MGDEKLYVAALKIQNADKLECFTTDKELLLRAGSLDYGDKVERVYSITHGGEFTKHRVIFTDRLELVLEG